MLGLKVQDNSEFAAEIIRQVRDHETLSRVELARVLNVAASTIGRHVDSLVAGNYFTETLEPTREAGRPPTRLRPNAARGCFLGVDFYAGKLFASAVNFAQKPLKQIGRSLQVGKGPDAIIAQIVDVLRELQDAASMPILGVGIATPGRVDSKRGIGLNYALVPGWTNVPLAEKLAEAGFDIVMENNIRCMALAERWAGQAHGCQELICLGVRSGVNAGIIRSGELATGHHGLGGEIRDWNCPMFNGEKERWEWNSGATVEKHSSVPATITRWTALGGPKGTADDFIAAARSGDKLALMALRESASIHGWTIAQMAQLTDPEIVIIAGPFTSLGEVYLDTVTKAALQFESEGQRSVPIVVSEMGDYVGAVGATALALHKWRPADIG